MLQNIWDTLLYHPLLNALSFLVAIVPGGDVGLAIILLTILVKLILFPLSQKSIQSQAKMSLITPEINKIKESGKNKEEQARLTFELYKKHGTNPFSGCLLVLIQIPIIFALYFVFLKGLNFDDIILYSFVKAPENINTLFLGIIDLKGKSVVLALLAGVTQYLQARFMPHPVSSGKEGSFAESLTKSMHLQMKYLFPILMAFISYSISGAVALYFITSNIFAVGQQIYVDKKRKDLVIDFK